MARACWFLGLLLGSGWFSTPARAAPVAAPSLTLPALNVAPQTAFVLPVNATAQRVFGVKLAFLVDPARVIPDTGFVRYSACPSGHSIVDWNIAGDTVFVSMASDTPVDLNGSTLVSLAFKTGNFTADDTLRLQWLPYPETNIDETAPLLTDGRIAYPVSVQNVPAPPAFSLSQNTPNPFNPSTTLRFGLPEAGHVTLAVYDVNGRLVRSLAAGRFEAGRHEVVWDGCDSNGRAVGSGVYLARLTASQGVVTRRMVLLR
ncbi:MAG TPA: FlgD immunoglobulin-like domain containing protein [Candidatus Latescibacteria bacterium]|nr:FlgD immunoglobulin-like domain containing protein [Candidatus Latescibacterota bacterium]